MSDTDYGRLLVQDPAREVGVEEQDEIVGHEYPTRTYMNKNLVPESTLYTDMGWIYQMPDPNPHIYEHYHKDYDEIILHIGSDPDNPEDLGAKVNFVVEGQEITIDKTSAIYLPKEVKHGPVTWEEFDRPHIQMSILPGAGTVDEADPGGHREGETGRENVLGSGDDFNYENLLVQEPAREIDTSIEGGVKGRDYPTRTYLSKDLVPQADLYLELGWIKEMPDPSTHVFEHYHKDYNEIVYHIGSDPDNPEDLGGKIEFQVEGQPLTIEKTSAIFLPKGVKHGPVTWKEFDRPHIEMTAILGAGTMDEADPAGRIKGETKR